MTMRRRTEFALSLVAITACAPTRAERLPHPYSNPPPQRRVALLEPAVVVRRDKLVTELPPLDGDVPEYAATCASPSYNCQRDVHRPLIAGYPAVRRVQAIEGGSRVRFIPPDFRADTTWSTRMVTESETVDCVVTQRGEREFECETTMAAPEVAANGVLEMVPPLRRGARTDDPCDDPGVLCNPPRPQRPPR